MPNQSNITKPILIVGAGRTASSYFLRILSDMGHTQILKENDYVMAIKKMVLEGYWLPHLLETQTIDEVTLNLINASRDFFVSLFPSSKENWTLKAIWEEVDWEWFQKIFPNANYVHLVRNPKTNISSMMEFIGVDSRQGQWDLNYSCQKYISSNLKALMLKEKGVPYLLVRQEDLVDYSVETWKKICDFLKIPFIEVDFLKEVNASSSTQGHVNQKREENYLSWEILPSKVIEIAEQFGYHPPELNPFETDVNPHNTHHALENLTNLVEVFNPNFRHKIDERKNLIEQWEKQGLFPGIKNKIVLDWECGDGVFSFVFLEKGAKRVLAIDSWLENYMKDNRIDDILEFKKIGLLNVNDPFSRFDLVFANTVTEHLKNLPELLIKCFKIIKNQGYLFINHDNYYQPTGAHDHGFLFYGENNQIVRQGVACWEDELKCEVSQNHREKIAKNFWWTWSGDEILTPKECTKCPYYKRSQPWAHLIYQTEFKNLFNYEAFTTGYPNSSLNKVTPFQLQQFIIEAGFTIVNEINNQVSNIPPDILLSPPYNFSRQDLTTATVTILARKEEK